MKAPWLIPAWLLLSSWHADPEQVRSNQARLIVYRTREFGGTTYVIKVNDQAQGKLPTNRYLQLDLPPGRIKIESVLSNMTENRTLWVDAHPGRTYYVKAVEEMDFFTQMLLLAPMPDEQAQRELRALKPIAPPRPK